MDFDAPVAVDDASSFFYKISWTNESTKRANATEFDFVSRYATTDPFEDFAETYTYYRLHGSEFRTLAETNSAMAQKYQFMKWYAFDGKEFGPKTGSGKVDDAKRNYDVTVLPFSLADFFG